MAELISLSDDLSYYRAYRKVLGNDDVIFHANLAPRGFNYYYHGSKVFCRSLYRGFGSAEKDEKCTFAGNV